MLFQNYQKNQNPKLNEQILTPINQFWYIEMIARPDLIISTNTPEFEYLISLLLCIIFNMIPLFLFIELKRKNKTKKRANIFLPYLNLSSIIFQLQPIYLQIPLCSICFKSLQFNFNSNINIETSYLNIVFAIITLFLLCSLNFLTFLLCRESIDFDLNAFLTLKLSFIDFVIWITCFFQIIAYYHLQKFNESIQAILLLFNSLMILVNTFNLITCLNYIIIVSITIASYQFIQSILILINLQLNISTHINILLYILVPLLNYILIKVYHSYDFQISTNTIKISIIHCKYILSKFFNDEFTSYTQKIVIYAKIQQLYQQKKNLEPIAQLPLKCINQEFMSKELINFYYKTLAKQYLCELQKTNSKSRNANHYIHYASILFKIGLNNLSLKQINILLFNQNFNKHSRSLAKENQSDHMKSLNTIQQGAKSSYSRSSKSQEVQEAGNHQINKTNKMLATTGNNILTFYQKVRLYILREKVRDKLKQSFLYREIVGDSFGLQNAIEIFLKSERRNQILKDQVLNLVNSKLQFFIQLQQVKQIKLSQLFKVSKELCLKIQSLEIKLLKLYKYFPSQRIQSLYTYCQGELFNNYLDAHKITCNTSISDEKLNNLHNNTDGCQFTLFNKDLVYLNINLIDETQELLIQNITPRVCQFFQKTYDDFKLNNSIDILLPTAIKEQHFLLVQRFLQTSVSKFYLKKSLNFYKIQNEIIKPCEFFFEVNFSDINQIQFLAFFYENFQTSAYLMVDVNYQLGGITQNLLDKLGYTNYYLENIKWQYINQVPIELLIPNFTQISNKQEILNVSEFKFLKQSILLNPFSQNGYQNYSKGNFVEWQNPESLIHCESLIQIHQRELFGFLYFIVEIKELKTEITYKTIDKDFNSIDQAFSYVSDQEAIINSPCVLKIDKQKFEVFNRDLNQFIVQGDNDKWQQFYQPDLAHYEINLMSPMDLSMNPMALNSANPLLRIRQQEFFSSMVGDQQNVANSFSSKNHLGQGFEIQQEDQNNKQQIRIKGEDTNSSSYGGAKKSKFFKKYQMYSQVIAQHNPKQLRLLIILLVCQFLFGCIHFLIIMIKNQADLNQFISEIDMIELHSSFMAPHDIFVSMRLAIISYNSYVTEGVINQTQATVLTQPFYDNIYIGYSEIKEIFIKQLTNQNLQPFFENKTIDMVFMNANTSDVYNKTLNIREAFQQIIQNLYQYKYRYENRMSTSGSAIQVFGVANQFYLHSWLEILTIEILEYSKYRSESIKQDWTVIWIVFILITIILTMSEIYYYRQYNQRYDKYLGIFKFCNQNKLQYEIDRYKIMQRSLQKNADQIFLYNFDLNQKESQLITQAKIQDALSKKNKDQQRNIQISYEQVSIIMGSSLMMGVWMIFFGISIIIFQGQMTYLNKYSDTVDIYKLIQDMTYSSATLYQNREYHFIFQNFTYLTKKDEEQIFNLIYSGIENIEKFNKLCTSFDQNAYQVNDDFVSFFNKIQKDSVCDILTIEQLSFLKDFCPISIQGNYLKGVIAALNFIKNQIQTQIVVNNFTKRLEHPFYDNEAGIIMVRVFQLMTQKLKSSMLGVTNDLQNISLVLSTIYLIFALLSILILILGLRKYLEIEFNIVKRFIQLLPTTITLLEDQFERYMRVLLVEEINKSQEDIAAIQDYMSQLPQFHAPYEILKELCYSMNYKSFKHGEHVNNKSEYAYFILKGQILADNGDTFGVDIDTHCIIVPINTYKNFNHTHGSNFQYRKNILLQNITSIDKINSSKIQEKLIRTFTETTLSAGNIIYKQNESAQYLYVLSEGVLQISRFYEKKMTQYEKQVLPKKYWQTEINICQLTNSGVIGEELLYQDLAFYNVKIISKIAVLQMISIKQLKNFLNISVVIQSLQDLFHDKHIQREEIFNQQCEEMEKNWQSTSKQQIINSEIKKTISFKVLKSTSEKQQQTNNTTINITKINISNTPKNQDEELAEFQRTKSPVKKIPNFIQQYFKQKQLESNKKTNEITLQQFIQRQQHYNNPYQLFEKVHDPLNYIQKGSNYKRQQFSVLIQHGIVKIKNPQIPKQPKRPITSYLGDEPSTNNNNNNDNSQQQPTRLLIKSVHTPKPIVGSLKKFYRSQSAHKNKGFSLLGKSYQQQSSPRDNMFYLRSNSSHNFKLSLNKSSNQSQQLQVCYTDKKIQCEESLL
ncbi:unnamed protein product [Paramecium sonneborni]|uniref:Cyclic nucleotide-binding domain-containing protein n=1 Tax=Paramecium sonneborni TaxID=65129 RepID=A0A8S1R052_9CILI|nr:unnamed protein product [Paramecium sonneborni]